MAGHGSHDRELDSVCLAFDTPAGRVTATLRWLNRRRRLHAADAATAPARELAVAVDGEPTSFITVAHGERFAAVGRVDRRTITIAGHGDPADPALSKLHSSEL